MSTKVFDSTYVALKREVTAGNYHPGQRLQARALADKLGTSTSPVTDAMRQLLGENVLEYSDRDGFIIPRVNIPRIHDLYYLNDWLTARCVSDVLSHDTADLALSDLSIEGTIVATTERLMAALAAASQNGELLRQISNVSDRLRACRLLEAHLFDDLDVELSTLLKKWNKRDWDELRANLAKYHDRRLEHISQLVSLAYRERD